MKSIIVVVLLMITSLLSAQNFSEKVTKELSFEKTSAENALIVANINGSIAVTGYEGDKILVEATKSVSAKSEQRLQIAREEVQLNVIDRADTLILYVNDGCNSYGRESDRYNRRGINGWGYNWNCNNGNCNLNYDYKVDITVKVPFNINLVTSTVNQGEIDVDDISGAVVARNINGGIKLSGLTKEADAHTINGDVDIEYRANPSNACRFYSLNGDINAVFRKGLAANLSFESFNGEFFTNLDNLQPIPVQVKQTSGKEGIKFKVEGTQYKIGTGGAMLDFETFNGNVYLKEL